MRTHGVCTMMTQEDYRRAVHQTWWLSFKQFKRWNRVPYHGDAVMLSAHSVIGNDLWWLTLGHNLPSTLKRS